MLSMWLWISSQQVIVDLEASGTRHLEQPEEQVRTIQNPSLAAQREQVRFRPVINEIAVHPWRPAGRESIGASQARPGNGPKPDQGLVESHRLLVILLHELLHT